MEGFFLEYSDALESTHFLKSVDKDNDQSD